jgi:predicted nucleic acid-binding protein
LFADAWRRRASITFADGIYVVLAEHLGAPLLTDDRRLVKTPNLGVQALQLP